MLQSVDRIRDFDTKCLDSGSEVNFLQLSQKILGVGGLGGMYLKMKNWSIAETFRFTLWVLYYEATSDEICMCTECVVLSFVVCLHRS